MEERCDLFHDVRNVLACLHAPPETGFVSIEDIGNTAGPMYAPVTGGWRLLMSAG